MINLNLQAVTKINYLVQGWHKFNFLLSPNEVREIFKDYHMVIFNAHVPIDYTESDMDEYIAAYKSLYELLLGGERIIWPRDHHLFLQRGVTSDVSNCKYGHVHMYEEKQYKSADFDEPVAGLSQVALSINKGADEKLHCSTAGSCITCAEDFMGIQLQYPKMIQYKVNGVYEPLKSAKELKTYRDFEKLKADINGITRPLTIRAADTEKRTGIRISDEVRSRLNECYSFMQKGVTVK